MNKSKVMKTHILKYGGEYTKKDGRWYWKNDSSDEQLVTMNFLINYKPESKSEKEEPKVEPKVEVKKEIKKSKPKKTSEIVSNVQEIKIANNSEQI